ncbi:hypothetical protein MPTK1_6g20040 [Marchantia polymorpha subsp. ruderalis]|uniref:Uncharacterized protein n=2 Tax=Marchantia polymorpha TaxID=3197 RepID=A0A176VSM9_MARPO|nr:hypothetical protein AXG93_1660s1090 [Marchantia polymorpha subsp. ruderalis]PTQ39395.1 hypothetical protein MARPO_0045s0059 [Marchantia polymorpha]BBN15493.1 hypothetical protein Mp_6g20040 [Marchantia polymorpha subsp. ruderalis]|eukprot:PTQ39395.1 hypothetical protein MARPO_0045s0059 [Marchantia polymorpha]
MVVQTAIMSTLNPNAPLFIPASFMAAEDFSPEWWRLVETCPAFRDYWLRERFESGDPYDGPTEEDEFDAIDDLLDIQNQIQFDGLDIADDLAHHKQDNGLNRDVDKDVVSAFIGLDVNSIKSHMMWREPLKHHDKVASKALKSPRKGAMHRIQQPRA